MLLISTFLMKNYLIENEEDKEKQQKEKLK